MVCKKIFFIKALNKKNIFVLGVLKSAVRGCKQFFLRKKIHRGIRNQKLGKVKNFQVWVA